MSTPAPPDPVRLARELEAALAAGVDAAAVPGLVDRVNALFTAHQHVVFAACLRAVGDRDRAVELAQDSLLRAWQKLPGFRGDASFRTWLVAIARYECINAVRKRHELLTEDGVLDATDPAASALGALRRAERDELLRASAEAVLDPVEHEVIHLRYVEHVPLEQITALLALPEASGARGVLQRCKRKLGRELQRRLAELGHGSSFLRESR